MIRRFLTLYLALVIWLVEMGGGMLSLVLVAARRQSLWLSNRRLLQAVAKTCHGWKRCSGQRYQAATKKR